MSGPNIRPKKNLGFGFGFRIKFYTYWYRNQQMFKIFGSKKIQENFFKKFQICPINFSGLKNFKH